METFIWLVVILAVLVGFVFLLNSAYNAGFRNGQMSEQQTMNYQQFKRMDQNEKRYLYLRRTTTKVVGLSGDKVDVTPELLDDVIDASIRAGK